MLTKQAASLFHHRLMGYLVNSVNNRTNPRHLLSNYWQHLLLENVDRQSSKCRVYFSKQHLFTFSDICCNGLWLKQAFISATFEMSKSTSLLQLEYIIYYCNMVEISHVEHCTQSRYMVVGLLHTVLIRCVGNKKLIVWDYTANKATCGESNHWERPEFSQWPTSWRLLQRVRSTAATRHSWFHRGSHMHLGQTGNSPCGFQQLTPTPGKTSQCVIWRDLLCDNWRLTFTMSITTNSHQELLMICFHVQ